MPVSRTLSVLDLYDVLTDLIPGTMVVSSALLIYPPLLEGIRPPNLFWIGALFGGYITGHFLRVVRDLGSPETDFQDSLRERDSYIHAEVYNQIQDRFELDSSGEDSGTLYAGVSDAEVMPLVLSYLETRPAVRALRMQSMYSFYRSMYVGSTVVLGLGVLALILKAVRDPWVTSWTAALLALLLAVVGVLVFRVRREKFKERFVTYTFLDFYSDALTDQD